MLQLQAGWGSGHAEALGRWIGSKTERERNRGVALEKTPTLIKSSSSQNKCPSLS